MADRTFDILIDIQSRVAAIDGAIAKIQQLNKETTGLSDAFSGILKGIQLGLGIDLVNLMSEIPAKLREAVEEGIRFNAFLESANIGVAGMLRQFAPERYQDFKSALSDSGQLIDLLRSKANLLGISFEAIVEQYRTTAGALFAGGVVDLQRQVDLTVLLQQAVGSLGITGFQAQRDIFDLLEGRASRTIAGKALGISDEEVQRAKEAGQLYEFLTTKFGALSESGKILGTTFQAAEQRAKNLGEQLAGIATQDVFGQLKKGLEDFNATLASDTVAEKARGLGGTVASLIDLVESLTSKLNTIRPALDYFVGQLNPAGKLAGFLLGPSFDQASANQFTEDAQRRRGLLLEQIGAANTLDEKERARLALDSEIDRVTQRLNDKNQSISESARTQAGLLGELKAGFDALVGSTGAVARNIQVSADALKEAIKLTSAFQAVQSQIAQNTALAQGDKTGARERDFKDLYQATFSKLLSPTGDNAVEAARTAEQLVNSARQRAQYEDSIKTSAEGEREARGDITTFLREGTTLIQGIRQQQELIAQSPFLSVDEKDASLFSLITQEIAALNLEIAKGRELIAGGALDPQTLEQVNQKLQQAQFEVALLGQKLQTLDFGGSLQKSLADFVNNFGNAGQQVGTLIQGTVNASLQGTNQLITGLITGTGNWRQVLTQVESQIVNLFLTWIEQMALQKGAQLLGITTTTSAQVASGGAIAAAHAPAAAATSISSFGAAAIIGEVLALAAIVAIIAALGGGFKVGGYTGDGSSGDIAGVVHRGEYVMPADVTAAYGSGNFDNLVRASRTPRYDVGGFVGAGAGAGSGSGGILGSLGDIKIIMVRDDREAALEALNSTEGQVRIVRAVNSAYRG